MSSVFLWGSITAIVLWGIKQLWDDWKGRESHGIMLLLLSIALVLIFIATK